MMQSAHHAEINTCLMPVDSTRRTNFYGVVRQERSPALRRRFPVTNGLRSIEITGAMVQWNLPECKNAGMDGIDGRDSGMLAPNTGVRRAVTESIGPAVATS